MKILFLSLLLVNLATANLQIQNALKNGLHPFSDEMVNLINDANLTWKAKKHFSEKDFDDVKVKLGTFLTKEVELKDDNVDVDSQSDIPETFDGREKWPECKEIIDDIRDQGNCGSCWAISSVGVMSDRICITSKGKQKVKVSGDDLISCCTIRDNMWFCGYGCNGGWPKSALGYWVKKGIVSGGNFNETDTCRPYEIEPCGHHNEKKTPCKGNHKTPECKKKCVNNNLKYEEDKHYGSESYKVSKKVEDIQREIMNHGSVVAAFTVMSDFPQYESGVYIPTSHSPLGGHAVRIIGWGVEGSNKVPYWLIANSWNRDWGDKGYFKMIRGNNSCGIESEIVAGTPSL